MISIYLRPDKTQVVEAVIKKDNHVKISKALELDSFWGGFAYGRSQGYVDEESCVTELENLFISLRKKVSIRSEEVYIVLPDFLFSVVDCFEFISDENLLTEVTNATGEKSDAFYISFPMHTEPPAPVKKSVYAIRRTFIDRLTEAATNQHVAISSVEPASISYFRSLANWSLDHPIVEIFEDYASIVTYSPAGGIFRNDAPSLTAKNLRENALQANQIISSAYAANDYSCSQSFSHMRTDAEYTILCADQSVFQYDAAKLRLPKEPVEFPEYIEHNFEAEDEAEWMPVVGTLLQGLDAVFEEDPEDNPVFDDLPIFIHIKSCNLLPDDARLMARNRQWQQIVKRLSKVVIGICVIALLGECGVTWYFNSAEISPKLQADYDNIVAEQDTIKAEMDVLKAARTDNYDVIPNYENVVKARPQACGFTEITIGSTNPSDVQKRFITIKTIAQNEMIFQDFRDNLENIKGLSTPTIMNITTDLASGYKNADIQIGRGGGKSQ